MDVPENIKMDIQNVRFSLDEDPFGDRTESLERLFRWMLPGGLNERTKIVCKELGLDIEA